MRGVKERHTETMKNITASERKTTSGCCSHCQENTHQPTKPLKKR